METGYKETADFLLIWGGVWAVLIILAWAFIRGATKIKTPKRGK